MSHALFDTFDVFHSTPLKFKGDAARNVTLYVPPTLQSRQDSVLQRHGRAVD
jgi:hypothetical protein